MDTNQVLPPDRPKLIMLLLVIVLLIGVVVKEMTEKGFDATLLMICLLLGVVGSLLVAVILLDAKP